jgi:hypothetical protein
MSFFKKIICKLFNIKECQCPPTPGGTNNSPVSTHTIVGHCSKHTTYKYTCIDCNFAVKGK